ncbi:hypothetical protein M5689_017263 [Euphorbia peplus]|nr:hypothetical protein M5689_017263 [Euphorbia peplus]
MALRGGASLMIASARQRQSMVSIPSYLHLRPFTSHPPSHTTGIKYGIRAVEEASSSVDLITSNKQQSPSPPPENWKIKMLYDGDCPLCMREVNMLRDRNKTFGTIKFVDISSEHYSPQDNQGLDYKTAMGRIHAILSDGTVVTDVDAFKGLYEQVGLGWVYAITKYEPIGRMANAVYGVWAKYRLQVTGRPPIEEILESRKKKAELCKDKSACKM